MKTTSIEWTDVTWNPVRGCSRVSEGCRNCYAERVAARFAQPGSVEAGNFVGYVQTVNGHPAWTGKVDLIESKLEEPLHWRAPRRVFVNSMSDLFQEALPDEAIDRIFAVMALCPQHTFQILTKRAERMLKYMGENHGFPARRRIRDQLASAGYRDEAARLHNRWPLANVWLGVSVEDQASADERIPLLLQTPAAVRFVSYEPALGPVDFRPYIGCAHHRQYEDIVCPICGYAHPYGTLLDWIIAGGESGPSARACHPDWFRMVRDQCQAAALSFFFKQWGAWSPDYPENFCRISKRRWSHQTFAWGKNGEKYNPVNPAPDDFPQMMYKVGKKKAGALLDDREWREFPDSNRLERI